ncbi:MAG: pyridoxamine 5'-phosphate oxidase family protein [Pseudomonadota bacterium]
MSDKQENLWNMIDDQMVCMVTTNDNGVLRSRPMAPFIDKDKKTIRFMTDRTSGKVEELHHDSDLVLNFMNDDKLQYVSISGRGKVTTDRAMIKQMWGPYCDIWFTGDADTADVAVVLVEPTQAEYWDDNTGKIKMAYEMSKAYFSDEAPDLGENAKLQAV